MNKLWRQFSPVPGEGCHALAMGMSELVSVFLYSRQPKRFLARLLLMILNDLRFLQPPVRFRDDSGANEDINGWKSTVKCKRLIGSVPAAGFEPATFGLQIRVSEPPAANRSTQQHIPIGRKGRDVAARCRQLLALHLLECAGSVPQNRLSDRLDLGGALATFRFPRSRFQRQSVGPLSGQRGSDRMSVNGPEAATPIGSYPVPHVAQRGV